MVMRRIGILGSPNVSSVSSTSSWGSIGTTDDSVRCGSLWIGIHTSVLSVTNSWSSPPIGALGSVLAKSVLVSLACSIVRLGFLDLASRGTFGVYISSIISSADIGLQAEPSS